jgi:hypothetical protein
MASSEVAVRAPLALPDAVQQLGVEMREHDGVRAVFFPQELRGRVNVLLPVAEVAQADPHFSPSIRLVELEKERHTYAQGNNRNALSKQGLEILANTAGIFDTQATKIPTGELDEGEIGYAASIKIRRSDGTIDTITRTKIVDREVEAAKIADEVSGWMTRNNKTQEQGKAEYKKRWLKERGDMHAKCESKAVLRAIRAALQIPHVFTDAEMKRPFLVIGYSFTPDWSDPQTRQILVSHGPSAGTRCTGQRAGYRQRRSRCLRSWWAGRRMSLRSPTRVMSRHRRSRIPRRASRSRSRASRTPTTTSRLAMSRAASCPSRIRTACRRSSNRSRAARTLTQRRRSSTRRSSWSRSAGTTG